MPRLPGTQDLRARPVPQAQMAQANQGLMSSAAAQNVATAQGAARVAGESIGQIGAAAGDISERLYAQQQQEQRREDAIARSLARTEYFAAADQAFLDAEESLTSKEGFGVLSKKLEELKQKTVESYSGSDEGRSALLEQLNEAHSDYIRQGMVARSRAIDRQFQTETTAAANRLAAKAYELPTMLPDMFKAADAYLEDAASSMSAGELAERRAEMHGTIAYAAIDGMLNRGDYANARAQMETLPPGLLSPKEVSTIDRRARELEQTAMKGGEWKLGPDGVLFNEAGEMRLPPPEVQSYLRSQRQAGAATTRVDVNTKGRTAFEEERSKLFAKDLAQYDEKAKTAEADAATAVEVDRLLRGVPTGNLPADVAFQVSKMLGINQEQVSSREAADARTAEFLLAKARALAPVTDMDKKFIMNMSPGSAQTPKGRAQLVYIYKRNALFEKERARAAARIGDLIADGLMSEGQGRTDLREWEKRLRERFEQSFSPPGG